MHLHKSNSYKKRDSTVKNKSTGVFTNLRILYPVTKCQHYSLQLCNGEVFKHLNTKLKAELVLCTHQNTYSFLAGITMHLAFSI